MRLRTKAIAGVVGLLGAVAATGIGPASAATCSLELWKDGLNNGKKATINFRNVWVNLDQVGLDNAVSAFRFTCPSTGRAYLAADKNGGGSWLTAWPNTTIAVMPPGWNDRPSSVLIVF